MTPRIGVLAYGSLIQRPGDELLEAEVERRSGARTPFRVEFARSSNERDGAPTLIPVDAGGAHVEATVIVLRDGTSLEQARDMVYRREINAVGDLERSYRPDSSKSNQVYVEALPGFAGLDWVLYTRIFPNIDGLTPNRLADLAIKSAQGVARKNGRDGISYLRDALLNGIRTPLSDAYREAILQRTDATSLDEALEKVGANSGDPDST
ncbi:MAG: hypothetical protein ACREX3_08020 [Gammaproteobacteria bacterium]